MESRLTNPIAIMCGAVIIGAPIIGAQLIGHYQIASPIGQLQLYCRGDPNE
jgi:hypothetical protein